MKRLVTLAAMLMLMAGTGCGGDTHESLAAELMSAMKEMVTTFETVKDEASAKIAKPKLESIAARMKALNERRKKLPEPTEAETKTVMDKYGKEMMDLQRRMMAAAAPMSSDPKIIAVLGDLDLTMN